MVRLILTDEEKRLLEQEGITLPGTFPLTKVRLPLVEQRLRGRAGDGGGVVEYQEGQFCQFYINNLNKD